MEIIPRITLPERAWEHAKTQRKLAETAADETIARDFIAWAVQHYAPTEFWCDLHLWHLANRAACVSKEDLKRMETLKKRFLARALRVDNDLGTYDEELVKIVGGAYVSTADEEDDFLSNLSNTRLPSENADEKTRQLACDYIDAIGNVNDVLRGIYWKEWGKPWTRSEADRLRETIHRGLSPEGFSKWCIVQCSNEIRSLLETKYSAVCTSARTFLQGATRKGQGWALHLGFLLQAYHSGAGNLLSILNRMKVKIPKRSMKAPAVKQFAVAREAPSPGRKQKANEWHKWHKPKRKSRKPRPHPVESFHVVESSSSSDEEESSEDERALISDKQGDEEENIFTCNGDIYDGEWKIDPVTGKKCRHGNGVLTLKNGTIIAGIFKNGYIHRGRETLKNGYFYDGYWKVFNGVPTPHGRGTVTTLTKQTTRKSYNGMWKRGRPVQCNATIHYTWGGIYNGEAMHGRAHGEGKLTKNGYVLYEGEFHNGMMHGSGIEISRLDDGTRVSRYEGEFKENKKYGHGVLTMENCNGVFGEKNKPTAFTLECEWRDGVIHGDGKMTYHDGATYTGGFTETLKRHGRGMFCSAHGTVKYFGEYRNNMKHGRGVYTRVKYDKEEIEKATRRLEGIESSLREYENDHDMEQQLLVAEASHLKLLLSRQESQARARLRALILESGEERYVGMFENDKINGYGVYTWRDGDEYKGEWKDDKMHGDGVFTWKNGDKYDGQFKDNMKNGIGVFTWVNGDTYEGDWKDGSMHGNGVFTYANGSKHVGEWKDNYTTAPIVQFTQEIGTW